MKKMLIALAGALLLPAFGAADAHPLSLWQVAGQQNRVYLLGSIHLLREQDHPLPSAIYDAYRDAETLIMELDMDDLDPVEGQMLTNELGLLRDGTTLADLMGEAKYAEAAALAEAIQVPIGLLSQSEPWLAAMNVELLLLTRMGFDPAFGIEARFSELAQADAKEIVGLETLRQQFELLDGLSLDAQRSMLLEALAGGIGIQDQMDAMIDAWKAGDVAFLEDNLLADMESFPELNRVIVVDRNRAWATQIEAILDDTDDYLVVVGALHLVGEQGVPALLADRGHTVLQLSQPE